MVVLVDGFTVRQIDEMHSTACNAIHGFIILRFRLAPLVGDPALYAQARVGAAVKECCHSLITESGRDRNRAGA